MFRIVVERQPNGYVSKAFVGKEVAFTATGADEEAAILAAAQKCVALEEGFTVEGDRPFPEVPCPPTVDTEDGGEAEGDDGGGNAP